MSLTTRILAEYDNFLLSHNNYCTMCRWNRAARQDIQHEGHAAAYGLAWCRSLPLNKHNTQRTKQKQSP